VCPDGNVLGVFQLARHKEPFKDYEIKMCLSMASWMATSYIKRIERKRVDDRDTYIHSSISDLKIFLQKISLFSTYISSVLKRLKNKIRVGSIVFYKATGSRSLEFEVYEEIPGMHQWEKNPRILKEKEIMDLVKIALYKGARTVYNTKEEIEEQCTVGGEPIENMCIQPLGTKVNTSGVLLLFNREGKFVEFDYEFIWQTGIHITTAVAFSLLKKKVDIGNEMSANIDKFLGQVLHPCIHERMEVASLPKKVFRMQLFYFKYYPTKEDKEYHLLDYTVKIFAKYGGKDFLKVNKFYNFLMSIYKSYRPIPYHNFTHAFFNSPHDLLYN